MYRRRLLPLALLLAASCSFDVSQSRVDMAAGETTTVVIQAYRWFSGSMARIGEKFVSSDPTVLRVWQEGTSTTVHLEALRPGTAVIRAPDTLVDLVIVTISACPVVSVHPIAAEVAAKVGVPTRLQIVAYGAMYLGTTWFEEKNGQWLQIPFADGDTYTFTPRTSGTFRFHVVYRDRCGEASTIITVVASTRIHAVRP